MQLRPIPHTDLKVSPLCYGVMRFGAEVHGDEMFDLYRTFRAAGGNFFDTAHCYTFWTPGGQGCSERGLGECLRKFGDRRDVVIMTKGAHNAQDGYPRPDDCLTPAVIASDITDSLERLQIEQIDLYTLHQDNGHHTVEEIIDTLNAEIKRGRIRHIGASNWKTSRIAAANTYAASRGLQGFVVSSPQWNLGCLHEDPSSPNSTLPPHLYRMTEEDIAWHRKTQVAVMPWTAAGYGFFDEAATLTGSMFDNPKNRVRRDRAKQLAQELGATSSQIALAYLLAYDFPVFPILGTKNMGRLNDSLGAADLNLTPQQRDWLLHGV